MTSDSNSTEILPLFPLNVVLFPLAQLPLHIFEERYKKLIGECLEFDSTFGINLLHDEEMQTIGCTAVVKEVTKRYPDGRLDVVVEGRRRYTLINLVNVPHPYRSGNIQWYEDIIEEVDTGLQRRAVAMHNEFVAAVFNGAVRAVSMDDIRKTRSFYLVQKAGLELRQRQDFLSMTSENTRLAFLVRHWQEMLPQVVSRKKADELARNDGYIQE